MRQRAPFSRRRQLVRPCLHLLPYSRPSRLLHSHWHLWTLLWLWQPLSRPQSRRTLRPLLRMQPHPLLHLLPLLLLLPARMLLALLLLLMVLAVAEVVDAGAVGGVEAVTATTLDRLAVLRCSSTLRHWRRY